jgi:hypothetical protein
MKITVLAFMMLAFFNQCNSLGKEKEEKSTDSTQTDTVLTKNQLQEEEQETSFQEFAAAFVKKVNAENLFNFISKDYGLFILHNPGAFPVIQRYDKKEDMQKVLYREAFSTKFVPQEGSIPAFSCDEEGWNKMGCFWKKDIYANIKGTYDIMLEYQLMEKDELNEEDYTKAEELSKQQTYCLYATDIVTGFYFINIDNQYYLYLIDVIDPCSA